MNSPHQKALVKLLRAVNYRHSLYTVFSDFVEMAALSVSVAIDLRTAEAREQRYMRIIGKYEADEQKRFPEMFAELVAALDDEPSDVLGKTFGELEMGNACAGQFFTPYELCKLMARVIVGDGVDMRAKIAERGFVTASEPACGAGGQVIALAEAMHELGIDYQEHLHVTAVDIDARAAHMTYLQLSLLHVPAVVIVGNTLSLEEREHWFTPAHCMGLWDVKLRRGFALGSALDVDKPVVPKRAEYGVATAQLGLFEGEAA